MQKHYAQAFLKSLEDGMSLDTAVLGLKNTLAKKQHSKLFGAVLFEVQKVLETTKSTQAVVSVARSSDLKSLKEQIEVALSTLGATKQTRVKEVVDETLIGGFVVTHNYQEHDVSYKKTLKSLYESIVK